MQASASMCPFPLSNSKLQMCTEYLATYSNACVTCSQSRLAIWGSVCEKLTVSTLPYRICVCCHVAMSLKITNTDPPIISSNTSEGKQKFRNFISDLF